MLLFFLSSFVVWHFFLSFLKIRLQETSRPGGWEAGSPAAGSLDFPLLHLVRSHEEL